MKSVEELNLGSNDAEDYNRRENKQFFNNIFVKDTNLEKLLNPNTFFLIGEKGTGKTAYAVYLSNNEYKNTSSRLNYIRETEYKRFIELKRTKNLQLSDYVNIWTVLLLVLISKEIKPSELEEYKFSKNKKLKFLNDAIDEYYLSAFSPEINQILNFVNESSVAAELVSKYFKFGGFDKNNFSFSESRFQINLQYIERKFKESLADIKIKRNHYIFIDGIDFRPDNIPYSEYLECVKGLSNAVWQLNNDFFANIKDKKGRFKVILLMRPDIFDSVAFQNASNKILNNSVYLDWRTDYINFMNSNLMILGDRILETQQNERYNIGECWNHYFSWKSESTSALREFDPAFIDILKLTLSRPRDIVTIMLLIQKEMLRLNKTEDYYLRSVFKSHHFKNAYSEYLLSGIKDQLSFYYTKKDWNIFLKFFSLFEGKIEFTYDEYIEKYKSFEKIILNEADELPEFVDTPELFLQFLYDTNIICYIEEYEYQGPFFRWCYRERNSANISPKVKYNVRYRFHYGLHKKLNIGRW